MARGSLASFALASYGPSEGFPRLAYLGPGAGWDGGREDFENSRRSAPLNSLDFSFQNMSKNGCGKNSLDFSFGPGPRAHGPWAHGPMGPGPMGPRSGKLKIPKLTSALEKNPRTFRRARIDPSRQGVMTQAIFVRGDIHF